MSTTNQTEPSDDTASFGFKTVKREKKASMVRGVFDRVAERYDLMNDLMSGGVHRVWKDMVIARANPRPGEILLDVAGGTGDLSRRFVKRAQSVRARRGGKPARAIVCDINAQMLIAGLKRGTDPQLSWVCGDAETLPLPDACVDAVTISFGIRNVTNKVKALADMRRVLRPGGRFLCLEFSKPINQALQKPYDLWSFHAIPRLGQVFANDRESYQYLVESIRQFPDQDRFADMMRAAGFSNVGYTNFSGGVAALHTGWAI
ncbi:MAG: bifunctional demethylmenaquinone methyltransferase/2-methoxy-6-polyprenyl-1,4-benzoquinol methylase [Robiginitomaculum sp.]|nr:MAG: bifunctional demethylmenaquinone methyltransferase/2-methoxy-6-polyprenyl-1,4-benzoquinol methylase [Robiginitomaculum sp.]